MPEIPDCDCARNNQLYERVNNVCMNTGGIFLTCLSEFAICAKAQQFAFDHTVISMITQMTIVGTAIESFSQEAQWEAERVIRGLEARLLALSDEYYAGVRALPPERQKALKDSIRKMMEQGVKL